MVTGVGTVDGIICLALPPGDIMTCACVLVDGFGDGNLTLPGPEWGVVKLLAVVVMTILGLFMIGLTEVGCIVPGPAGRGT